MPLDESLAARIRASLARKKRIKEKKMFGGLGFLLNGNMLAGVWKNSLIVRLSPEEATDALLEPHVGAFDITGKPMKGWILVDRDSVTDESAVKTWINRAVKFVAKMPAK